MDQISVVIPTQGRMPPLTRTLTALSEQDLGDVRAELILVCSGCSRPDQERVRSLAESHRLPAKVLARDEGGAAGARNAGVGVAESDLILFLNDDTPPLSTHLLREHSRMHVADEEAWRGILGPVIWHPEIEETPVMAWLTRSGKMNDYTGLLAGEERSAMLYAPNLSIPKAALTAVGGFDERFWRYGWEEYDLALRLVDRGFEVAFVPELVVGHHHVYSLRDSLRRMESMGRGANLFNRIHRSRQGLVTPEPTGLKARVGRILAPFAPSVPVPASLPTRLRDSAFQILHYAMLARGYARSPIPEGAGPEGGIPGHIERVA